MSRLKYVALVSERPENWGDLRRRKGPFNVRLGSNPGLPTRGFEFEMENGPLGTLPPGVFQRLHGRVGRGGRSGPGWPSPGGWEPSHVWGTWIKGTA
eukprot:scaffold316_cov352-Pavlova_lutheri.AAC.28